MEYAIIIVLLVHGIIRYDFRGYVDKNNIYFKSVYILMVLMSGLAYRVGADLVNYESSYYTDYNNLILFSWERIFDVSRSQFGWFLLSTIFYKMGVSFTVFKLIQASFFQYAVFLTVKRYTSYRYVALLLFFLFLFPHINFNVLRESFAIGFFLLSIPHVLNRNWIKYYIYIFCAFMFHSGAILLALFPLFMYLDFSSVKKVVITTAVAFVISLIVASYDITDQLLELTYSTGSVGLYEQAEHYLLRDKYALTGVGNIAKSLLFLLINILPLYYLANKGNAEQKKLIPLAFMYVIVSLVNNFVPIAYRYKDYTYLLFFLVLSAFLVEFSKKTLKQNHFFVIVLFALYLYPVRSYFAVNAYYNEPAWVQYYPYHSVIDKGTSLIRERTFYK